MTDAYNALRQVGYALLHDYPNQEKEILDFMGMFEGKLNAKEAKWSKKK
jgi:hypothetical protein